MMFGRKNNLFTMLSFKIFEMSQYQNGLSRELNQLKVYDSQYFKMMCEKINLLRTFFL